MNPRRFTLDTPPFADTTDGARAVTVAVVDSGIHPTHPHVGGVVGGVCLAGGEDGTTASDDFVDRLGHGTAVAAAIREKAPHAELLAVRVFDRALATSAEVLARGIVWAADHGARVINLSLGTPNTERASVLRAAVGHATGRGALVVSARELNGVRWLPGSFAEVIGVSLDWECDRDAITARVASGSRELTLAASGYPRPIPGVPPERNLSGVSFAVANASGFLARLLSSRADIATPDDVRQALLGG